MAREFITLRPETEAAEDRIREILTLPATRASTSAAPPTSN